MQKIGALLLVCFGILLLFGLFSGFDAITGQITKENIITSISPQGEINTKAVQISVLTSEKANCMYNLGIKDVIGFKYYITMTVTGEFQHIQLLNDLKDGSYEVSIKCTDRNNYYYRKDVDLIVKLPNECVRYCEYINNCDEYASDGCGLVCKRDTDGVNCGEGKVCKDSSCIIKEAEKPVVVEKPVAVEEPVVEKSGSILNRILSFLRGLFR